MRWLLPLLLLVGCAPKSPAVLAGGIHINEPDLDAYAQALLANGLDTVQVTAYARQGHWNSAELGFGNQDPQEVIVQLEAAKRANLKVVLVLRTYLEHAIAANRHLWHGMIWPADDALDAWFDSYRAYALWGARLAADYDVELLVVGNELNSMSSTVWAEDLPLTPIDYFLDPERTAIVRQDLVACADSVQAESDPADLRFLDGGAYPDLDTQLRDREEAHRAWASAVAGEDPRLALTTRGAALDAHWRSVIDDVRHVFDGSITYGANFDQFHRVGFWDAVDALGVTSYFPLSRWGLTPEARDGALREAWADVGAQLGAAARGKPIHLLELGWTRKAGSTVRPWSYDRVEVLETDAVVGEGEALPLTCVHWASQPEDPTERVAAMRALTDVAEAGQFPGLRGFSLWKLTTRDYHHEGEQFGVLLPADVQNNTPNEADSAVLQAAAALRTWMLTAPPLEAPPPATHSDPATAAPPR